MSRRPQGNTRKVVKKQRQWRQLGLRLGRQLLLVTAVLGLSGGGAYSVWALNQQFEIQDWKIAAAMPADMTRQLDQAMQAYPEGGFWQTRPAAIRSYLLAKIPDIESIDVQRQLPGDIRLQPSLRTPLALWQDAQGKVMLMDEHGLPYRPIKADELADLPLLRATSDALPEIAATLAVMQQSLPAAYARLSEITVEERNVRMNFDHGQQWLMARADTSIRNMQKLDQILEMPRWRNGLWKADMRLASRWFLRPAGKGVI